MRSRPPRQKLTPEQRDHRKVTLANLRLQQIRKMAEWGLPAPTPEYEFDNRTPPRGWKFDWAWIESMVALEVEGGAWTKGRHTRGKGFVSDMEKYKEAAIQGWLLIRCTPAQLRTGAIVPDLKRALASRASPR